MIKLYKIICVSFVVFSCFTTSCDSEKEEQPIEMTTDKWQADIDYLINTLEKRHIEPYHTASKEDIYQRVDSLKHRLNDLSENEITVEIFKIVRALDDSHTGTWTTNQAFYEAYPLAFFSFENDGFRVIKTSDENVKLLGAKLLQIDNTPIDEAISKLETVIQCADNWYSVNDRLAHALKHGTLLKTLGIAKNDKKAEFEFLLTDSSIQKVTLAVVESQNYEATLQKQITLKSPFDAQKASIGTDYLWFQSIDNHKVGYIYFAGYPNALQMRRFALAVSRELMKYNTKKVIIDVRNNGGGNFFVGVELAKLLTVTDHLDWKNGVYVLTSRVTYSAGMSNTAHFKELLNAKLVGEPTGANPNDYQDADGFGLPNSKMWVQYSKRYYRFQDSVSNGIIPDVYIKPKWSDYQQNKDVVLEWVLNDIRTN